MSPVLQIGEVILMAVGFFLKTDIVIRFEPVSVFDAEHQPFDAVPDEERNVEQFPLLRHMDEFMIDGIAVQWLSGQDELAKCQCQEILPKGELLDSQYLGHAVVNMLPILPVACFRSCIRVATYHRTS